MMSDMGIVEEVRNVLRRKSVPPGQCALLKALYEAAEPPVPKSKLAETMQRSEKELVGILGALGKRINHGKSKKRGTNLVIGRDRVGDEIHYSMLPALRDALESEPELLEYVICRDMEDHRPEGSGFKWPE